VRLTAIDVRELKAPRGEEPIHWRLLTTHTVDDVDKARHVIAWYSLRWNIEQLFRTLKSQGLDVESSMLEDGTALERLVMLGIVAATKTMQLVLARDPATPALPVERVFGQQEIAVIKALQPRLEGRTEKQRNPHQPGTLGWASWTIARLGGWTGYATERPAGADNHAQRPAAIRRHGRGRVPYPRNYLTTGVLTLARLAPAHASSNAVTRACSAA
jgi:hypothetical protein